MKKKTVGYLLATAMMTAVITGCGSSVVEQAANQTTEAAKESETAVTQAAPAEVDLSEEVELKINFALGNRSRTITYNQGTPLNLPDGSVVTAGMLKPMWAHLEKVLNCSIIDVTVQDIKFADMIQTESTTNFTGASIFGGENAAEKLMYYGTEGKIQSLTEMMEKGYMPNFKSYLEKNPEVKSAITAYDGNIYHIPYIAELNNFARVFAIRESWVTKLLDNETASYDGKDFNVHYEGVFTGENKRTGENGGTVTPKEGIDIVKKTDQSIIEIQNNLSEKNGETLTRAMIQYIKDNYDYEKPSELFLGEKAAYDIDEMIALMRCIKANPTYLTEGRADVVWPIFTRQSSYREDLLRLATYFNGTKVQGADSYQSRWYLDKDGKLQYSYSEEGVYDTLTYLAAMEAEGLIYSDCYEISNKTNHRSSLWGTDASEQPTFGFMTIDWTASTTSDSLNPDATVILPPVAKVNGVWQYYIDNGRAIKPDGWGISVAGCTEAQMERACTLMDYIFSEDGMVLQLYGLPMNIDPDHKYVGPDGKEYPKLIPWAFENASKFINGDLAAFFRDWMGCQMPIGYAKEMGFEYQNTSERGFESWELLKNSTANFANYKGEGISGDNPNYYKMVPPVFSLTSRQTETLSESTTIAGEDIVEYMFNIVRYQVKGNAPQNVVVAQNYEEYLAEFESRGLDTYEQVYQAAYEAVMMSE